MSLCGFLLVWVRKGIGANGLAVLKDIEEEELLFQSKKQRRAARRAAEVEGEKEKVEETQEVVDDGKAKVETIDGAKFY